MGEPAQRIVLARTALCCAFALASLAPAPGRAQVATGAAELVLGAIGLVGVPYRFGGDDPRDGLDCSGLIRFVARNALGVQLPRQAEEISRAGIEVDPQQLQAGDFVFFNTLGRPFSHVGVYLGDDRFVHAPARQGQVRIEQFSRRYWRSRFDGARRLEAAAQAPAPIDVVVEAAANAAGARAGFDDSDRP